MKTTILIILLFIILISLIFVLISWRVMHFISTPKLPDPNAVLAEVKEKGDYRNYDSIPKEDFVFSSFDGYQLHAVLLKQPDFSINKYVIVTHGFTSNRLYDLKYANIFYDLGYHVIIYDIRHHGDNQRCFVSMGIKESKDITSLIQYIKDHFCSTAVIGLHGESLGSASSLMALKDNQDVAFLVEDCGFSDLNKLLNYLVRQLCHLPRFFVPSVNILSNIIYKNPYCSIRPLEHLAANQVPILFIHGAADTFIPPYMCKELFDADGGYKEICYFQGADHAQSYATNPDKYKKCIILFLKNLNQL